MGVLFFEGTPFWSVLTGKRKPTEKDRPTRSSVFVRRRKKTNKQLTLLSIPLARLTAFDAWQQESNSLKTPPRVSVTPCHKTR